MASSQDSNPAALQAEAIEQLKSLLDEGGEALDISVEASNEGGARFIVNVPKNQGALVDSAAGIASMLVQLHV